MALIPAFHEVYGWQFIPQSRQQLHPDEWSTYNPAEHNVEEVVEYLAGSGPRERARVLELERQAKARKGVLDAYPETPDAVGAGEPITPAGDDPGQNQES